VVRPRENDALPQDDERSGRLMRRQLRHTIAGGFAEWQKQKLPVEREKGVDELVGAS